MRMRTTRWCARGCARAGLVLVGVFAAGKPAVALQFEEPVGEMELQGVAGREATTQANITNQASGVTNSSVSGDSVTGNILLDGSAFQDFNGLAVINTNTGNNVSINASMQVNISIIGPQ